MYVLVPCYIVAREPRARALARARQRISGCRARSCPVRVDAFPLATALVGSGAGIQLIPRRSGKMRCDFAFIALLTAIPVITRMPSTVGAAGAADGYPSWRFIPGETCAGARMPHEHNKISLHDSAEDCVAHCKAFQEAGAALYHGPGELQDVVRCMPGLRNTTPRLSHRSRAGRVHRCQGTATRV